MPKVSKQSAAIVNQMGEGPRAGKEWSQELGGYKASFVAVGGEDADLTPLLKGLPNDECQCPHWGYVLRGRTWFRFGDREEIYEAGDAYYVPSGHTSGAFADSEFLIFSPSDQIAELEAHIARRMQELQGAAHS